MRNDRSPASRTERHRRGRLYRRAATVIAAAAVVATATVPGSSSRAASSVASGTLVIATAEPPQTFDPIQARKLDGRPDGPQQLRRARPLHVDREHKAPTGARDELDDVEERSRLHVHAATGGDVSRRNEADRVRRQVYARPLPEAEDRLVLRTAGVCIVQGVGPVEDRDPALPQVRTLCECPLPGLHPQFETRPATPRQRRRADLAGQQRRRQRPLHPRQVHAEPDGAVLLVSEVLARLGR